MNNFEIQAALAAFGHTPGKIDGIIGPKTLAAAKRLLAQKAPGHQVPADSVGRLLIAVEQLALETFGGLAVGPIDGFAGPLTQKARQFWLKGPWRSQLMTTLPGDERMPAPVKNTWPLQTAMEAFYGPPGSNLTTLYTPYPLRLYTPSGDEITRFQCHAKVKSSLDRVLAGVLRVYGYDQLRELRLDVFGGCFNNRPMRGGTALSTHAYAAAVDWDPQRNGLRSTRKTAAFARPEYDAWWAEWTKEGWLSLGKARDFDWMHIQAARLG